MRAQLLDIYLEYSCMPDQLLHLLIKGNTLEKYFEPHQDHPQNVSNKRPD